jgi:EF hand
MQKHILVLMTSAFILACGAVSANAQQSPAAPTMQQPDQQPTIQQMQELARRLEALAQRRWVEDSDEDWDDSWPRRRMMGGGYGADGRHQGWGRGGMGSGMTGRGGGIGQANIGRLLFILMDADGDGTISLDEFRAVGERIFKAMDGPDKDGRVTWEEMRAFIQGARGSVPRQ